MAGKDEEERRVYREKLDRLLIAVCGDEPAGIDGLVQKYEHQNTRLDEIEGKLDKDNDLLWWNRKANDIWEIVKKPAYLFITLLILLSILGFNGIEIIYAKLVKMGLFGGWMKGEK